MNTHTITITTPTKEVLTIQLNSEKKVRQLSSNTVLLNGMEIVFEGSILSIKTN